MRCHRRLHFTRFFQTAFLELRIQFLDFYCFVFRGGVGYFEKYEKYRAFPAFRKVHSAKAVSPLFAFNDAGFHVPFQHPVFVPAVFSATGLINKHFFPFINLNLGVGLCIYPLYTCVPDNCFPSEGHCRIDTKYCSNRSIPGSKSRS